MKRMLWIMAIFSVVIIIAVVICAPLIENYEPEVKYYSGGYAHTKGVLWGLCTGDIVEACSVVYLDHNNPPNIHPEKVDPKLLEKFESYCQLIDGRQYTHIVAVDYTLEGDYPDAPYVETCYMEITLEDNTMMYAVVVFRQDIDGCGVTHFDLYTECPW